jgi:dGTPase
VDSADAVRRVGPLVAFSPDMRAQSQVLKTFLLHNLYRHPQVMETTDRARQVVSDLFTCYLDDPAQLPDAHASSADSLQRRARRVADYIAGMTDRFAIREHERLLGRVLFP